MRVHAPRERFESRRLFTQPRTQRLRATGTHTDQHLALTLFSAARLLLTGMRRRARPNCSEAGITNPRRCAMCKSRASLS